MKKIGNNLFLVILIVVSLITSNNIVEANDFNLLRVDSVSEEVILGLSLDDYEKCYQKLVEYKSNNPNSSNKEMDKYSSVLLNQAYKEKEAPLKGYYDDLVASTTGMTQAELKLAKQYPSDLIVVYSSSNIANNQAKARYNSGAYLGNQDAFRHAAWNAVILCRFYALNYGDFEACRVRTKLWTDAHENGAYDPALSASQNSADKNMDLINNAAGRAAAESTYTSYTQALTKVQEYVDNGNCFRIKTDAQMTYSYDQMKAIPNWELRRTNTVGKK